MFQHPSKGAGMKEEWLMPGAVVPVDPDTTKALVDEIKRLIGVIGGMALQAAAPVQEPVATLWQHGETGRTRITMPGDITDCDARWFKAADLYTTPPAEQRQCKWPTCQSEEYQQALAEQINQELVTGAAQRQWVGLTDDEFENIELGCRSTSSGKIEAMQKVEAKLKEKNGLHRQHVIDGSPCWCEPETSYTDPETGASVVVHKEPQ
jgi:hypothetical protein